MTMPVYLSDVEYSHPPEDGPSPLVQGGFIPSIEDNKKQILAKKPEPTARAQGCAH